MTQLIIASWQLASQLAPLRRPGYPQAHYPMRSNQAAEVPSLAACRASVLEYRALVVFRGILNHWIGAIARDAMDMDPVGQYRPAPQFEQQQIAEAPATPRVEPPELDAMAQRLDQMKIDAAIDAERTRPGLNGFFALVLFGGIGYVGLYLAQYQTRALAAAAHGDDVLNLVRIGAAIGIGMLVAVVVGVWSVIATRRVRRAVQAYERELLALGGTPLPERGLPLHPRRAKGAGLAYKE